MLFRLCSKTRRHDAYFSQLDRAPMIREDPPCRNHHGATETADISVSPKGSLSREKERMLTTPADFLEATTRVRACYSEDPGLSVTAIDLARLSGVSVDACVAAVATLDKEGVLHLDRRHKWRLSGNLQSVRRS